MSSNQSKSPANFAARLPPKRFNVDPRIYEIWEPYDWRNKLPPGWEGYRARSTDQLLFINRSEGKRQHLHPSGRFYSEGLPMPWESLVDKSGRGYYQNHETKVTQWAMPPGVKYVWGVGHVPIDQRSKRDMRFHMRPTSTVFNPKL